MLDNIDINKVCCFTGHRPQKLPWGYDEDDERCKKVKERVYFECEKLIENGVSHFITGMALGFDMICAEIVLDLKKKYPFIKLYGAIPCSTQCEKWSKTYINRYENILKQLEDFRCKFVTYTPYCMQERNTFMVDHSSTIIALYKDWLGGTKNTIDYALSKNKKVIIIDF